MGYIQGQGIKDQDDIDIGVWDDSRRRTDPAEWQLQKHKHILMWIYMLIGTTNYVGLYS